MSDKTILVVPGRKKVSVSRLVKRSLQVAAGVGLTSLLALAIVLGNGFLQPNGKPLHAWNVWLNFIYRTDILTTMVLTAIVTVLFVYWQRDQERK
jgi:ABC-type multidrug transport system permease subunit